MHFSLIGYRRILAPIGSLIHKCLAQSTVRRHYARYMITEELYTQGVCQQQKYCTGKKLANYICAQTEARMTSHCDESAGDVTLHGPSLHEREE
jgi:hypothetical protein